MLCDLPGLHTPFFKYLLIFILCALVFCLHVCMCTMYMSGTHRGQKRASYPLESHSLQNSLRPLHNLSNYFWSRFPVISTMLMSMVERVFTALHHLVTSWALQSVFTWCLWHPTLWVPQPRLTGWSFTVSLRFFSLLSFLLLECPISSVNSCSSASSSTLRILCMLMNHKSWYKSWEF